MPSRSRRRVRRVVVPMLILLLAVAAGCSEKRPSASSPKIPAESSTPVAPAPPDDQGNSAPPPATAAETPTEPFTGFAPEGTGQPTEFAANVKATIHFAGVSRELPCTMWFPAAETASPFSFTIRHDGSGYYDFVFGPAKQACRFTDPEGRELAALDARFSVEELDRDRTRSTFRLTLVKP